jgi:hypothetical protein
MSFSIAGIIVFGWITFAPKYDISAASRYEICGNTVARSHIAGLRS